LGTPRIEEEGQPVRPDTRKAIALLAYLAVTRQPCARSTLATLLWPDSDQSHAHKALSRTLSALNNALKGNWLQTDRSSIALVRNYQLWADVDAFRDLMAVSNPISEGGLGNVQKAVGLYQGDFLTGFSLRAVPTSRAFSTRYAPSVG
jgi:DNA-binding SARP family transcriptional activator